MMSLKTICNLISNLSTEIKILYFEKIILCDRKFFGCCHDGEDNFCIWYVVFHVKSTFQNFLSWVH